MRKTSARWSDFSRRFVTGLKANWPVYTLFVVCVMSLAAIYVAIVGISSTRDQNLQLKRLVECQNSYNEINNERTRELALSADRERTADRGADAAMGNLVNTLVTDGRNRQAVTERLRTLHSALAEQEEARNQTEQERDSHPVPPPPKALCGGTNP